MQRPILEAIHITSRRSATQLHSKRRLFTSNAQPSLSSRLNDVILGLTALAGASFFAYYAFDSRAGVHRHVIVPLLHAFTEPEDAHKIAIDILKWGLSPRDTKPDSEQLAVQLWGRKLSNPIGIAAGFDKHGEAVDGLFNLGFSYVEVGTVTPEPQPGNAKPRYFRLPVDKATINRYGFNSDGHRVVAQRLRDRIRIRTHLFHKSSHTKKLMPLSPNPLGPLNLSRSLHCGKLLGVNLGKNKDGDEIGDYVLGVQNLGPYADVLIVNVSSPNTPGLRQLQRKDTLENLLAAVVGERDKLPGPRVPVCVKIAPDLDTEEIQGIACAVEKSGIDGVIVSNSTIQRPSTLTPGIHLSIFSAANLDPHINEQGGLSGPPLKPLALQTLRTLRRHVPDSVVIIGCGGICTGKDAIEYARAGADFVQVYTSFGYDGPGLPRRLKDEILEELDGKRWAEIVGRA
ncbi:Dihydroorotate dehydrogenase (quinone), mitochondrial [Neolecta irregularis DAH-3]|uniref:Dihydroorotate dehydrogenase (quinone), mitochondrial n=1 Tax=Neolecta irregularis (strain DAH-3) TaxID=1198029 RepID=A0A1U7LRV7_NEOID|nr:Dihydroorotate dehydrogenase (quinone), mitochondrial [Neolecta irregularis DAH-3]|eukprot:OLL25282.1 Dihydroorotate dehydrogenase (quinone), mitochondrial [Neolecta irregularis DAH-3]